MDDSGYDTLLKIVIAGDTSVGKTNLLVRYCKDSFITDSKATIGIDFYTKDILIQSKTVKVQFWDTAGQEKYQSLSHTYYKMVGGVLLVYDITRYDTFIKAQKMLDDIRKYCPDDAKVMLIGNKNDLNSQRTVLKETATQFATKNNIYFWETSALTNTNQCVFKAIDELLTECMNSVSVNKSSQSLIEIKKRYVEVQEDALYNKKTTSCCQN